MTYDAIQENPLGVLGGALLWAFVMLAPLVFVRRWVCAVAQKRMNIGHLFDLRGKLFSLVWRMTWRLALLTFIPAWILAIMMASNLQLCIDVIVWSICFYMIWWAQLFLSSWGVIRKRKKELKILNAQRGDESEEFVGMDTQLLGIAKGLDEDSKYKPN